MTPSISSLSSMQASSRPNATDDFDTSFEGENEEHRVHRVVDGNLEDNASDYGDFGSDAEEIEIIDHLLSQFTSKQDEVEPLVITDIEDYEAPRGVYLPKVLGIEQTRQWNINASSQNRLQILQNFNSTNTESRKEAENESSEKQASTEPEALPQSPGPPDNRSPLERFRRPPKKALSVTDLVSPSWCELQYFYALAKHGRKRRTPAMRQGSNVHQALEDEVHTTVPIEITKIEDSWGLRIWNVIQGLRTLRETGRTRELEVWGTIGGEVVNGVIDQLSFECPDPKLEMQSQKATSKGEDSVTLPEYQTSITEFFMSDTTKDQGKPISEALTSKNEVAGSQKQPTKYDIRRIYITDVKTRGSSTLPTGSSIRPTIVQLHLYHHLLENLAQGNFSLSNLVSRYNLDPEATFSDSFIAQIGSLNQDLHDTASSIHDSQHMSSQDSMDILLHHNNLTGLWSFMTSQFHQTFLLSPPQESTPTPTPQSTSDLPSPVSLPTRLSPLLTAEYISQTYKHVAGSSMKFLGRKSFIFNASFLKSYLEDNLAWWRGERAAKGVELQEAWKCRSCDFRDDCEWIHERDRDALNQSLERKKMREVAGVEGKGGGISKSHV